MKIKRILCTLVSAALLLGGCGTAQGEYLQQGMSQIGQLDYEGALESFAMAAENKEDEQMICRGQGIAYMGLTDYEAAAACLEQALTFSDAWPDQLDYDINYYLATAYYKSGRINKAIEVYKAITALRPKENDAWYLKGIMELEKGNEEQAKADFDQAAAIAPTDYDQLVNIYNACSRFGCEEMGQAYLQAVLADENVKLNDFDLGRISYYLGNYEQARLSLETAREKGSAEAAALLGQTYEKLGDYNYAASVYSNYIENRQPDARIYNQLGLCKMLVGDHESALKAFREGIDMADNTVMQSLKFNEIVACESLGRFDEATLLMEQYLKTYPDDTQAMREYDFLKTR